MRVWAEELKRAGREAERQATRGVWWLLPAALVLGAALYAYCILNPTYPGPGREGPPDHVSE